MLGFPFPPAVMSVEQAAFYLGDISPATFRKKVAPHLLKVNIAGRRVGFLKTDLDNFIAHETGLKIENTPQENPLDRLLT